MLVEVLASAVNCITKCICAKIKTNGEFKELLVSYKLLDSFATIPYEPIEAAVVAQTIRRSDEYQLTT